MVKVQAHAVFHPGNGVLGPFLGDSEMKKAWRTVFGLRANVGEGGGGVPKFGLPYWGPYYKGNPTIWGSILGVPLFS